MFNTSKIQVQKEAPAAPVSLPCKISSITVQANRKHRFSIYCADVFLIGIDESVLLRFDFKKGDEISESHWQLLWIEEQKNKVFHWLLNRLELRAHGRNELKQKAKVKGFPDDWIEESLERIAKMGLLDDVTFAESFAKNALNFKKWGPLKIRFELKKKGISDENCSVALTKLFCETDFKEEIEQLIRKKVRQIQRETDLLKRKQKLIAYLMGKGFPYEQIKKHVK